MATQLRLRSALALITGAGSGIGRAVCVRLAREGATVAACDLDGAAARETLGLLGGPGNVEGVPRGAHAAFQADVSEAVATRRLLEQVQGIFLVTQAAAQALVSNGCHGSIINISSIVGKVGNMGQTNYAASKAGVIGLTQTVARELGRHGIRCNSVLPGFITTPMMQKVPQKVLDQVTGMIPMGHLGDPQDVADVVAFLASDDSGYITGASVEVTGMRPSWGGRGQRNGIQMI
ncbi:PREDICTED: estradiol 17-beta-dehydrogenase 8 isoform X3 [Hipposideros armiger]|uniref:Estradiol 17-beta-dehydrogenase 8 isoform X3 n=1 Tax=Hipposideros armiger TaxID=186990 RepID=A0A8B7SW23_HIPAR|nr:PREDICTED: estradiol 17-beta-dehydrogenase 8 isoform X3 [Hipposideros armiger]